MYSYLDISFASEIFSTDAEGDYINISSDDELLEALDQFDGSIFKIHLKSEHLHQQNILVLLHFLQRERSHCVAHNLCSALSRATPHNLQPLTAKREGKRKWRRQALGQGLSKNPSRKKAHATLESSAMAATLKSTASATSAWCAQTTTFAPPARRRESTWITTW